MEEIDTILISHSHEDYLYASELVDIIKVTGIESKGIKIICSSVSGHTIPKDVPIYDYLREEIKGNIWVIYLLSHNYYKSAGCLNEMGATWVLQKRYSTFMTPHFNFSELKGAIDPSKNAFQLNEKAELNDFKNIILKEFDIEVGDNIWESIRDTALNNISEYSKEQAKKNEKTTVILESVRKSKVGDGNEFVLRVTNLNPYPVSLYYLEVKLWDIDNNEFIEKLEPNNIILHPEENKLIFLPFNTDDSPYSITKHQDGKIEAFIFQPHYY